MGYSEMIIVKLSGRLGNQLFQYATGLATSKREKLELYFYWPEGKTPELVTLLNLQKASPEQIESIIGKKNIFDKILRKIQPGVPPSLRTFWLEKNQSFDKGLLLLKKSSYLDGYWQSFKYFQYLESSAFDYFRELMKVGSELDPYIEIAPGRVIIHVRRTDAIVDYGEVGLEYYYKAMKQFPSETEFLVVSDDINFCKLFFAGVSNMAFAANVGRTAKMDMNLMIHGKGVITANSTFSWWGAYLNERADKLVIAPKNWHIRKNCKAPNLKDIYPSDWILV